MTRRSGRWLFAVLLIVCAVAAPRAKAGDAAVSRTLSMDPSGTLTIADIAAREGTPVDKAGTTSTHSVFWMRLRIAAPRDGSKTVIFIRPAYLSEVRLYEAGPGAPSTWKTRVTGDNFPFSVRDRASLSLCFVVDVPASGGTYYLRFKTRSPVGFSVEAVPVEEADRRDHVRDLLIVFFATAMLGLLLWAIHTYLLDRRPVVGLFALHQGAYLLFGLVAAGYLAPFVPRGLPHLVDWINLGSYCTVTFTLLLFCRELFKLHRSPRVVLWGFEGLLLVFPIQLVAMALGWENLAANSNAALVKVIFGYLAVTSFFLHANSVWQRCWMRAIFVSMLLVNVTFWFMQWKGPAGWAAAVGTIQVLIFDGLVIGVLFAMLLHVREQEHRLEAHRSAMNLLVVQKQLELEQKLKLQAEAQAQTDYLTGLCNRRHFVELAEAELQRAIRYRRPLALLMVDVDHFKSINDSWGHMAGDAVLQRLAETIREELRSIDILARMGGEEFAAILVETEGSDAVQIAERLCKVVAAQAIAVSGADDIHITISIGVSQRKGRPVDFDRMLLEADRAMYLVKQNGRNGFAFSGPAVQ